MKRIDGMVVKGLGEGAFFMSMEHYRIEIKQKLGFEAYPGTLNVKVNAKVSFKSLNPIRIEGYTKGGKKFGGASCYRAKIKNINGAILVPDINKNPETILELIAPLHIKSTLNIKDNDEIEIELVD